MTITKTIKISMTSSGSEADLSMHIDETIEDIKAMKYDSWRTRCYTDYDESSKVEIEIYEISDKREQF